MTTLSETAIHPDPSVFLDESIAPETAAFNEALRAQSEGVPGLADLPPAEIRASRAAMNEHLEVAEVRAVPGSAGAPAPIQASSRVKTSPVRSADTPLSSMIGSGSR